MNFRTIVVSAVLAVSSLVYAQTHRDSFVYQGTLQDEGAPADGLYDIAFAVFDATAGGNLVAGGFAIVPSVQVTNGLFEAFIDFGVTGSVFDSDTTRWLELQVRPNGQDVPFDVLSPRQRISPAPLANYALRSGTSLQDAYDNGSSIILGDGDGPVEIRSSTFNSARLNLGSDTGTESSGRFYMYGPTGNLMITAERDGSIGGGGFVTVKRNDDGANGIILEGNASNTESSQLSIFGPSIGMLLSTRLTNDASVQIPNNAINALEIINEVGAAEVEDLSATDLTDNLAAIDVINSVTIFTPTDGYVLVIASAEVTIGHATGTSSSVNVGVSRSMTAFESNTDLEVKVDDAVASGIFDYPVTSHAIFEANGGPNTYYLLADKNYLGGFTQVQDIQLSAIFIPTSYGNLTREPGQNSPDEFSPIHSPMSNYDIVMERNAALEANDARMQRELDAMKLQMQQLLEKSTRDLNQQTQD